MTEPDLIRRQKAVLQDLAQLSAERAAAEEEIESGFRARNEAAETGLREDLERLDQTYAAEREATEKEFAQVREDLAARFEQEAKDAKREHGEARVTLRERFEADKEEADTAYQEAVWTVTTVFEAAKSKADGQFHEFHRKMTGHLQKIDALRREADEVFAGWVSGSADEVTGAAPKPEGSAEGSWPHVKERVSTAEAHLLRSRQLFLLRFLKGKRFLAVVAAIGFLAGAGAALSAAWYVWAPVAVLATAAGGAVALVCLKALARSQVRRTYIPLCQALVEAEAWCKFCQEQGAAAHRRELARSQKKHDDGLRDAEGQNRAKQSAITGRRDTEARQADEQFQRRMSLATARRDSEARDAEAKYPRLLDELRQQYEADTARARERHRRLLDESRAAHDTAWEAMAQSWREGLARAEAEVGAVEREGERLFPGWDRPAWQNWAPPTAPPPVLRFGAFGVTRADIPHGVPADERLHRMGAADFTFPAWLGFPDQTSLLIQTGEGGKGLAEQALLVVMFRLLTSLPPGKVRFTIIDPVGLGQSFAAFMHLADHDEALVASRIWTESAHIEQRLADLTAHMENVIQKYLRNQYETIEEYNAHAGEVAEPFRFLMVANFPVNFSPEAARRLVSVAASGARCGVHTLVTCDAKQPLPQGFQLKDLERHATLFECRDGRLTWREPDFGRFPLRLDDCPEADFTTSLLQKIGKEAKEASRVEVPFSFIAPAAERWWSGDTRSGIDVALGRSGATKRQHLSLGKGTSQHVVIAGKTGSGKSTLLHALITNLSLLYSPEQVELYLVDFKEGVEFKDYATYGLPHARVVAIESEREFGLSVLQRLEAELQQRGDRFRALGVQDLAGYRQADAGTPLPRILLIVDEFQLFFTEDDKIAQDAALLLDRLVRQGRAFGIHVLLGSQTLGGAYTLARSTLGQMAVRIALQCSEADAHLILSDDNPAARLLSRPGEAIYNDANGLVEGNDFFQVVWLPDGQREDYLRRVRDLAQERGYAPPRPQIVFEGRAPGDLTKNHMLDRLLRAAEPPAPARVFQAWLGEPVAIKEPTAADFRPQSGRNLLMVGQQDEAALGIMTSALLSLAAQIQPGGDETFARFYVLDGSPVDAANAGYLKGVTDVLPHPVKVGGWRDVLPFLVELAGEVERRLKEPDAEHPARFLFVHGLQRFRDLRRAEDDFGFSRRGENAPPNPGKLLGTVLRDGPPLGVYTLVWADTLHNVNRAFDRQGVREFDLRVLFQMSASDSSNLIDAPLAAKLGLHRALFHSEERGQAEKFRPYGLPAQSWLEWVKEQWHSKAGERGRVSAPSGEVDFP